MASTCPVQVEAQTFEAQTLSPAVIVGERASADARFRYHQLVKDVKFTYPFAVQISRLLEQNPSRKELKKAIREDLTHLDVIQANLLIKLIQRQAHKTCFELLNEYEGRVAAWMTRNFGSLSNLDYSATYDPQGSDQTIERIVASLEEKEVQSLSSVH